MAGAPTAAKDSTGPSMPASIPELLAIRRAAPDGEFLITDDERLSFAEADTASLELADALLAAGVGKGTRVGILFPNCAQWLICWLAAARIGALTVPLSTFAPGANSGGRCGTPMCRWCSWVSRSPAAISSSACRTRCPASPTEGPRSLQPEAPYLRRIHVWPDCERSWATPWPRPEPAVALAYSAENEVVAADDLVVVTTSGTTGLPKSVVHTHGSLVRHAFILARHRGVTSSDRIYSPMAFFWVGGLTMVVLQALSTGAAILAQDVFEAGSTLALLERERATFVSCWAQASQAMADHPDFAKRDLSSVRGGTMLEALPPDRRPRRTRPGAQPARHDRDRWPAHDGRGARHPAAAGAARLLRDSATWRGGQHRVVDPASGVEAPAGHEGEIQVRGQIVMNGVYKRERHDVFGADGWYATGDRDGSTTPATCTSRAGQALSSRPRDPTFRRRRSSPCWTRCPTSCTASSSAYRIRYVAKSSQLPWSPPTVPS